MSTFLEVHGIRIPVLAPTGAEEDYQEVGGEVVRSFGGPLLSTVKGHARVWRVQTPPMPESEAQYLVGLLRSVFSVPVTGKLVGGGPVLCMVRGIRTRPAAPLSRLRRTIECELHEAAPRVPDGNLLRNAGFEEGYPGYAPHWDVSPSHNLLGPDAAVEIRVTGSNRYRFVGTTADGFENAEPLEYRGIRPGDTLSWSAEMFGEGGAQNVRLLVGFWAADGSNLGTASPGGTNATDWDEVTGSVQVPAGAARWMFRTVTSVNGTAHHVRNVMVSRGDLRPYEAPSPVLYDPARAHGGNRYLAAMQAAGSTLSLYPPEAGYLVRPGDRVHYGLWAARDSGDAQIGAALQLLAPDGSFLTRVDALLDAPSADYALASRVYVVGEGVGYVRAGIRVGAGTVLTAARFDDVYLRIWRPGP